MKKLTKREREDFRQFCRNATDSQLQEILKKEETAGRKEYALIAQSVLNERKRH